MIREKMEAVFYYIVHPTRSPKIKVLEKVRKERNGDFRQKTKETKKLEEVARSTGRKAGIEVDLSSLREGPRKNTLSTSPRKRHEAADRLSCTSGCGFLQGFWQFFRQQLQAGSIDKHTEVANFFVRRTYTGKANPAIIVPKHWGSVHSSIGQLNQRIEMVFTRCVIDDSWKRVDGRL